MNGYYGDSAFTYEVGEVDAETKQLLKVTKSHFTKELNKQLPEIELEILVMLYSNMLKALDMEWLEN